jgi:GDP-D-mannose 3',5'-epimerase
VIAIPQQFFQEDLREASTAQRICASVRPELLFHLADVVAGIDFVMGNEPFVFRANTLINSNTFAAAAEAGVPRLVYLGTACSYPRQLQARAGGTPLVEEQTYPADPESAYGWSKLMGEYEAQLLGVNSGTAVGILRAHNVYGPRSSLSSARSQVIPSLIRKAIRYPDKPFVVWGSGAQARDFVFVGDVVDALLRMPLRGMSKGVLQVSSGGETTVAHLASMIVELSGKDISITFDRSKPEGDAGRSGNPAKAERELGWHPSTPLLRGLRLTYDWALEEVRSHPGILVD